MSDNAQNTNDPYAAPTADVGAGAAAQVGAMPGMTRLPYFLISLVVGIAGGGLQLALAQSPTMVLITSVVIIVASIYLMVLRLRNIGWSPWLSALVVVPIANLIIGILALICPPGYAITKTFDTPAKIIGGIILAFTLLGVLAVALAI